MEKNNYTIMVVDDEPIILKGYKRILMDDAGYKVIQATSGEETLELLDQYGEKIDLMILDHLMPNGLNGLETFAAMKKRFVYLPPVFMITAVEDSELAAQFMEMGGEDFMQKSFLKSEELKARVGRIFRKHLMEKKIRELNEMIIEAHKTETIGNLAGGIAHDFNNILASIMGYAGLAMESENGKHREYIQHIVASSDRAKKLVGQILDYKRKIKREPKPIKISQVINESMSFLRAALPSNIRIECSVKSQDDLVLADDNEIYRVIMNLGVNAGQAMEGVGGKISILLDEEIVDNQDYLRLKFADTGCGIDPAIINKIFDQDFTTRENCKGNGMGLSIVKQNIQKAKGDIKVESELGKGTTFTIYLPKIAMPSAEAKSKNPAWLRGQGEKILIINSRLAVAEILETELKEVGYTAMACDKVNEAVKALQEYPGYFDLIMADATMPEVSDELFKQACAMNKNSKIVLISDSEKILSEKINHFGVEIISQETSETEKISGLVRKVFSKLSQRAESNSGYFSKNVVTEMAA